KAELPPTAWREDGTKLSTFEGHAIKGPASGGREPPDTNPSFSKADLDALTSFCRANLLALLSGATPNYYAFGVSDANVHGIVLSVAGEDGRHALQSSRL